ncbi:hypothetical protein GOP47_0023895 [Adiantum capillus-veneris]|uniref:HECT-type E3 ubiquitin transferase n=1 Tax=Adiantum capillus-veneris TaxID=13818 RepID=A0A9D4Z508_ADICA|nr:hypothetical protein GOP47_0023895 [Adiantum capillus-veneris]
MSSNNKVSLRGASAKEITRDALLQKATIQRNIRNEARRAASAAQLIQRVWRGYHSVCEAEIAIRSEWDAYVAKEWPVYQSTATAQTLTDCILRPFLFFTRRYHQKENVRGDSDRFVICFTILLQSINMADPLKNYCGLSTGSKDQQSTWRCQVHRLLRLSCLGLVEGSARHHSDLLKLASLSVRMLVALTDSNMWICFHKEDDKAHVKLVVCELLEWTAEGNGKIPLYPAVAVCIEQMCPLKREDGDRPVPLQKEKLLIVASAITVALRPLQQTPVEMDINRLGQRLSSAKRKASEDFCSCVLTIPYIVQRLPAAILPALQHPSVLSLCLEAFETLIPHLTTADISYHYFKTISQQVLLVPDYVNTSPSAAALTNIVALSKCPTVNGSTKFVDALSIDAYLKAVCSLLDQSLSWLKSLQTDSAENEQDDIHDCLVHKTRYCKCEKSPEALFQADARLQMLKDLEPLCQLWHLRQLLDQSCGKCNSEADHINLKSDTITATLKLSDIAMLYLKVSTVFKSLHEERIPCPVLNLLAFAPGFLCQLWGWLDDVLGLSQCCNEKANYKTAETKETGTHLDRLVPQKDERMSGSLSSRWASAVSKIKGKGSCSEAMDSNIKAIEEDRNANIWNIERMRSGPMGIPKEALRVLTLFCAAYGHLLMILDDEEFYERQVPFTLKQQRVIAASLNTLVYNGLLSASKQKSLPLLDVTIKCLNSLYGRDCRRSFCFVNLWLAPAFVNRPPIPAAARAHEVALASIRTRDYSQAPAIGYVLALIPHVIPFEERVQIFREFVRSDKMARKMVMGPGPASITVAVRRDHLVEDAFAQLNVLGSSLKSGINVSFVNELGLSEAGLDYGGLFKEFLTDLAKAAFDPGYGLFAQRETDEGLLFPHAAAGKLQHGLQMLEFLGRIVGKAIYEGILLDFSFSHVFIWKLLGRYVFFDELSALDPELHQNLMYLKHYEGDAMDLALDFTVTEELFGKRKIVELKPGGAQIQVTNENKLQYVYAMADYKLNKQMQPLISAFSGGLSDIISPAWLSLFNARELNQLISGGEHDFDVDDLKANTKYTGGFTETSRTIKQFWEVLREFEPGERCALLKFVTSCSRAPLLGFKHLQPAFTIHKVLNFWASMSPFFLIFWSAYL